MFIYSRFKNKLCQTYQHIYTMVCLFVFQHVCVYVCVCFLGGEGRGWTPQSFGAWASQVAAPSVSPPSSTWLVFPSIFSLANTSLNVSLTPFSSRKPSLSHSGFSGSSMVSRDVQRYFRPAMSTDWHTQTRLRLHRADVSFIYDNIWIIIIITPVIRWIRVNEDDLCCFRFLWELVSPNLLFWPT